VPFGRPLGPPREDAGGLCGTAAFATIIGRVPAMSSPSSATNDPRMEHDAVRAVAPSLNERQIMTNKNLADIAEEMAGIDIAILSTHAENGEIANRPMSNNGDVSYDGTSYYFTYEQARAVADIQRNPKVALGFSSEGGIFSDGIYVAVEGTAELIRDKAAFQQHWTSDLDNWFEKGVNTPGIVLIKVRATRATYWKGREEGEVGL
jgi:general stress protein 26